MTTTPVWIPRLRFGAGLVSRMVTDAVDPSPAVLRRRSRRWAQPDAELVCIYRRANESVVARLVAEAGGRAALWALDEVAPRLADRTVGSGPGTRMELLNRLILGVAPDAHVVIADDDVTLRAGDLGVALRLVAHLGFDLAQPAHSARSNCSWDFNRVKPLRVARQTHWVEQGPLVVLSPKGRTTLLPLPEELAMGWGIEVLWARAASGQLRAGVLDAVRMRHLGHVAAGYDRSASEAQGRRLLEGDGLSGFSDLQVTTRTWSLPAIALARQDA